MSVSKETKAYVDVRGFVFDTSSHTPPGNKDPYASGYTYHITESGKFITGPFSMKLNGLKPRTIYYYRACAHNPAGWGYGDEVSFTTKKKGGWRKIVAYLKPDEVEAGLPTGIRVKWKIRQT
ncbi:MAG: fibronectin type III domain-containing protein [Chloroflexota bacterium]|nr:fibronectin type III domain-containing protein [Chloroflexota bacterium]